MDKTQHYKNCDYKCHECCFKDECAEVWDDIMDEIIDGMQKKFDPKWPDR